MTKKRKGAFENSKESVKKVKYNPEDTVTTQNSDEEIVDTDESMLSTSPESDSEKSIDYSSALGTPEQYIIVEEDSDNFGSGGDASSRPKQFTTNMFKDDIERFNEAREKGKEAESQFIQDYINQHRQDNVSSEDDVYSLLLGCAIDLGDKQLVEHILSIKHEDNILTSVDRTHFSPVNCVLGSKNYEILKLVGQYITKNSDHITKTCFFPSTDSGSIASMTSNPLFEGIESIDFYKHLLVPLYIEESLANLANLIGANYVPETFDEPDTWW